MKLERELAIRINPEKSRRFTAEQFAANLARLTDAALSMQGQDRTFVSVVGTNGKGSTSYYLAQLFENQTGLYTSPHLHSVYERIRINLENASEAECDAALLRLEKQHDLSNYSYFELLTILAGFLFHEKNLPVQIFEAGLGGRLDATSIFRAQYVVLTSIGLDHTELLGNSQEEILAEKLGICTKNARFVLCANQPHLSRKTVEEMSPVPVLFFDEPYLQNSYLEFNRRFAKFCARKIAEDSNLALSPASSPLRDPPGRLERRNLNERAIFFDNAHNPDAIRTALSSLRGFDDFPGTDSTRIFYAVLPDRDPDACLAAIQSAGFHKITALTGEAFRPLPEALPAGAADKLLPLLAPWNIFVGSHRLYDSFLDLTRASTKDEH